MRYHGLVSKRQLYKFTTFIFLLFDMIILLVLQFYLHRYLVFADLIFDKDPHSLIVANLHFVLLLNILNIIFNLSKHSHYMLIVAKTYTKSNITYNPIPLQHIPNVLLSIADIDRLHTCIQNMIVGTLNIF